MQEPNQTQIMGAGKTTMDGTMGNNDEKPWETNATMLKTMTTNNEHNKQQQQP